MSIGHASSLCDGSKARARFKTAIVVGFYFCVFERKLIKSAMLKKAPRTVLKSHMKKKSDIRIGKNADLMVSFAPRRTTVSLR